MDIILDPKIIENDAYTLKKINKALLLLDKLGNATLVSRYIV